MIVRTWNVFHGNTMPPGRKAYLREMVELITADRPDDRAAFRRSPPGRSRMSAAWANMQGSWARAKRPKLGPFPIPASLGRGADRSSPRCRPVSVRGPGKRDPLPEGGEGARGEVDHAEHECLHRGAREAQFGLTPKQMVAWEKERRVLPPRPVRASRPLALPGRQPPRDAPPDLRLADAEIRRAVNFVIRCSELEETLIVGGDFNITARGEHRPIQELVNAPRESRWHQAGTGIDQFLLRRAIATQRRACGRTRSGRTSASSCPTTLRSRSRSSCGRRTNRCPRLGWTQGVDEIDRRRRSATA